MTDLKLGDQTVVTQVAEQLRALDLGSAYVGGDEESLFALVRGLADIEESCRNYCGTLLPRLIEATDKESASAALLEISQEFRHIIYHLADMDLTRDLLRLRWLQD